MNGFKHIQRFLRHTAEFKSGFLSLLSHAIGPAPLLAMFPPASPSSITKSIYVKLLSLSATPYIHPQFDRITF